MINSFELSIIFGYGTSNKKNDATSSVSPDFVLRTFIQNGLKSLRGREVYVREDQRNILAQMDVFFNPKKAGYWGNPPNLAKEKPADNVNFTEFLGVIRENQPILEQGISRDRAISKPEKVLKYLQKVTNIDPQLRFLAVSSATKNLEWSLARVNEIKKPWEVTLAKAEIAAEIIFTNPSESERLLGEIKNIQFVDDLVDVMRILFRKLIPAT